MTGFPLLPIEYPPEVSNGKMGLTHACTHKASGEEKAYVQLALITMWQPQQDLPGKHNRAKNTSACACSQVAMNWVLTCRLLMHLMKPSVKVIHTGLSHSC